MRAMPNQFRWWRSTSKPMSVACGKTANKSTAKPASRPGANPAPPVARSSGRSPITIPNNLIHRRIRGDLGERNFHFLSNKQILTEDGVNITMAVASMIVAIRGIRNTAMALAQEMDERGLAHLTASTTVNRPSRDDLVIYLARATVFNGKVRIQSLGTEAKQVQWQAGRLRRRKAAPTPTTPIGTTRICPSKKFLTK
jgi:sulfur transfer complex TusBCD TusB component (DsrH family)